MTSGMMGLWPRALRAVPSLRCRRLVHGAAAAVLIAAPLATAERAQALYVQQLEVTCPIDGKTFRAEIVAAFSTSGMRLDLKPLGQVVAPYPYPICPDNGFVIYKSRFSEDEMEKIRPIVQSAEYQRLRRNHTSYFMMAYVKERMGASAYDLGDAYLGASWEAERDQPQRVEEYRKLALEKFSAYLVQQRGNPDVVKSEEWWTAAAVSAELERLLGRFDEAALRVSEMPLDGLSEIMGEKADTVIRVVDQIRLRAIAHDAQPATVTDLVGRRT
jgi:hypothetical protein